MEIVVDDVIDDPLSDLTDVDLGVVSIPRRGGVRFPLVGSYTLDPTAFLSQSPEGSAPDFHNDIFGPSEAWALTLSQAPEGSAPDFHAAKRSALPLSI